MLALIILIIVLACVLAYVPGLPQIARVFLMIALAVLCLVVLLDVLGGVNLGGLGLRNRLGC